MLGLTQRIKITQVHCGHPSLLRAPAQAPSKVIRCAANTSGAVTQSEQPPTGSHHKLSAMLGAHTQGCPQGNHSSPTLEERCLAAPRRHRKGHARESAAAQRGAGMTPTTVKRPLRAQPHAHRLLGQFTPRSGSPGGGRRGCKRRRRIQTAPRRSPCARRAASEIFRDRMHYTRAHAALAMHATICTNGQTGPSNTGTGLQPPALHTDPNWDGQD